MAIHDCPCSGKTLARLVQPAVMAVLREEPLHGYLVVQRLARMHMFREQTPDPTGVYRVLKSMEQAGYVASTWQLADAGPAKRRFALTPAGRGCLKQWVQTLHDYEASIADLLAILNQAAGARRQVRSKCNPRCVKC